jgi:hypothetical protein
MLGPIEDTRYELTVSASSADVLVALTDFGPMRPQIWPETSHPRIYRVHEVGAGTAEVTEGVPQTWSRERYDWSQPGVVTLTQLDSNVSRNGTIRYTLTPSSAGTHIACVRHREFYGVRGRLAGTLMRAIGARILPRQLRGGIERSGHLHS